MSKYKITFESEVEAKSERKAVKRLDVKPWQLNVEEQNEA